MLTMDQPERPPETVTPTDEPTGLDFTLKPVSEKPKRRYRKGSKYDTVINAFKSSKHQMVAVTVGTKDANYMRTQLNKRLESLKLTKKIKVSVVNSVCYLEKS